MDLRRLKILAYFANWNLIKLLWNLTIATMEDVLISSSASSDFDSKEDAKIWEKQIDPLVDKAEVLRGKMEFVRKGLKKFYYTDGNGKYQLKPYVESKPDKPEYIIGDVAGWTFGVAGAISALMFLFHGVVWTIRHFVTIGWDTWHWALTVLVWSMAIAVCLSLLAAIVDIVGWRIYASRLRLHNQYWTQGRVWEKEVKGFQGSLKIVSSQLEALLDERFKSLSKAINKTLGLPFPASGLNMENYHDVKAEYKKLVGLQNSAKAYKQKSKRIDTLRNLMNAKLDFFYEYTLPVETAPEVYKMFARQLKKKDENDMLLRREVPHSRKMKKMKVEVLGYRCELSTTDFDSILDYFNSIYNRSTRQSILFFLTDTEKKAKQTKDMYKVARQAGKVYDALVEKIRKTALVLDYARTWAYHNVYLGVELVNFVRETSGGGSMRKAVDKASVTSTDTTALAVKTSDLKMDVSDKGVRGGLAKVDKDIQSTARFLFSSKEMRQWSSENLNSSLALVGVSAAVSFAWNFGGMIMDYFKKVNANADAQYKMVEYMNNLSVAYERSVGEIMRSIEIIEALSECNKGFAAIYEPLREKVLVGGEVNLTRQEIAPLAQAINKYKQVTESKLRNDDAKK